MVTETITHAHWWIVESPNGALIPAHCKLCDATRTFPASPEDDVGFKKASQDQARQRGGVSTRPVQISIEPRETVKVYSPRYTEKPRQPKTRPPLKRTEAIVRPPKQVRALTTNQQLVYDYVLAHPGSTGSQIADGLAIGDNQTHDRLAALRARGLIERDMQSADKGFRLYAYTATTKETPE